MSCKLWSKVTSVFLNINFCAKMSIFGKKSWISWEMLIFSNKCALLLKVNISLENMLIFRNLWLFVWLSIYIKKLSNLIKTSIFLRKWNFVRNFDFFKQLCSTSECEYLIGKHAYFQKILTFCVKVYIH